MTRATRADRRAVPDRADADTRLTFAVLAVGATAFALLQSMVIPVLSTIQEGLGTSRSSITWLLTAYLLAASVATPIVGRIGDMVGKQRMIVVALALLALGSVMAALAPSIGLMIAARVVQGFGGGVLPLSFGIVRDEFPERAVSGAIGTLAALAAAGAGIGIVVAGPVVELLGYRWLFWLPGIVVGLAAVAALLFVPESPARERGRISVLPPVLLSGWLVALLLGVSQSGEWGWSSPGVIGLLVAAAVFMPAWVVSEVRSPAPLIDMRMMRLPTVWTVNLVALLVGAGTYAMFAFAPALLQTPESAGYGFGASVTVSGLMLLPQAFASFVLGTSSAWLARTFGARRLLVAALAIATVSLAALAVAHDEAWVVIAELTLLGVGFGAAFSGMAAVVVAAVPAHQTGVASGMNANIRTIGGSIGAAVISTLITAHVGATGYPAEVGYTQAFTVLAVITLAAVGAALLMPRTITAPEPSVSTQPHAELGMVAGGTLAGSDPE